MCLAAYLITFRNLYSYIDDDNPKTLNRLLGATWALAAILQARAETLAAQNHCTGAHRNRRALENTAQVARKHAGA